MHVSDATVINISRRVKRKIKKVLNWLYVRKIACFSIFSLS
jgi:rRNA maturation endonuclease Nob1